MRYKRAVFYVVILLTAAVVSSACTAATAKQPPVVSTDVPPTATVVIQSPTLTPAKVNPPTPVSSGVKGFVLFDQAQGSFVAYSQDGEKLFSLPAPGIEYPSPYTTSIVDGDVYYMLERNRAKEQEPQVLRSAAEGVEKVNIPAQYLAALSVSPDEKWAAWSTLGPENGVSELWIGSPDGSQARKIATYNVNQSEAFFLRPLTWTADGKLIFERSLTGFGGYILFGGYNSLYSYEPETAEFITIVPAEELHGMCLDSYRLDLEKVIFNCSKQGPEIVIRDLKTMQEKPLPALPVQGAAGSARFSPSGDWLAYAVAANQPDNESGQIVIVPADQSTPPQPLLNISGNMYGVVQGWLDENTLLISKLQWPNSTIWKIQRDGTGLEQVATGMWVGWLP